VAPGWVAGASVAADPVRSSSMTATWSGEALIPAANLEGYGLVYEAETWLRRICLAAFLLADGPGWVTHLDPRLRGQLERQSAQNSARWYLGVDAEEELLWSTTHWQLAELLKSARVQSQLLRISGVPGGVLADRLRLVSEVRNAFAHNRAISEDTLTVLRGDLSVIRAAAGRFKGNTLYASPEIHTHGYPSDLKNLGSALEAACQALPRQQLFLAANDDFIFLVRLPVPEFGRWVKSAELRRLLAQFSKSILCVLANIAGDEVQIVMPRTLPEATQLGLLERFASIAGSEDVWTRRPPAEQHPADSCWPRLWFYENRRPVASA